jgi:CelD/BcsL family acetyltransferase involved in cellulose biosynthesis
MPTFGTIPTFIFVSFDFKFDILIMVKVWILYLDDEPVSFCLVLDTGPIRYQLINGYSKSVRKHSTGYILFKEMIFDAIETGVERICFGQGDPGHKGEWGAKPSVELIDLVAIKPGLFGKLALVAYNIMNEIRQMLRATRKFMQQ